MKLSDRDLKLLVLLLIAVVIACPILFVLRPYNSKIQETEARINELKERQSFLAKLNENRQFYNDSIALLTEERTKIINNYATGLRTENTVMFLANMEKSTPIAMRSYALAYNDPTVITEDSVNENGELVEGLKALACFSTVEYTATYDSFKAFLQTVLDSDTKMVVSSITADQDDTNGSIVGSFVLSQYAVSGEGRNLEPAKIPTMDHGVDNVFGKPQMVEEDEVTDEQQVTPEEN